MKKNKLLYIFALVLTVFSFNSVKAEKYEFSTAFEGSENLSNSLSYITDGSSTLYNNNGNSDSLLKIGVCKGDGWTIDLYTLCGNIVNYKGKSVNSIQIIESNKNVYTTRTEVADPSCFAVIARTGIIEKKYYIYMTNWEKKTLDYLKKEYNDLVLLRPHLKTDPYCNVMYSLTDNLNDINKLKEERKQYKEKTNNYLKKNEQILAKLNKREQLLNELETIGLKEFDSEQIEEQRNWINIQKKLVSTNTTGNVKGCDVFGPNITPIIKWAINLIRIGGVVLVVVFGVIDFVNILLSGEEKNFKEAGMKFVKRLIALLLLIFIPYILIFLLDLSGVLAQYDIEDVYCVINF